MLNKEYCQKCLDEERKRCKKSWDNLVEKETYKRMKIMWNKSNEKNWKKGRVFCPYVYIEKGESSVRDIKEEPPNKCPYYLEHVI